jgi:hypothetical protein
MGATDHGTVEGVGPRVITVEREGEVLATVGLAGSEVAKLKGDVLSIGPAPAPEPKKVATKAAAKKK